jgi:pSer/pThr/pTyr-binding forkhead associated (FHA) protein
MTLKLKIVQGKPRGFDLHFPKGEFVFGRGPECHVRPNSDLVSRQHCLLHVDDAGAQIRDLGSTNGTLVNGKRVRDARALKDGDTVQLGPLVLKVMFQPSENAGLDGSTVRDTDLMTQSPTQVPVAAGAAAAG